MNKIVILTSLYGNRDIFSDPSVVHPNIDYYAFVDRKYSCKIWNQILALDFSSDNKYKYKNRRNAKIYKVIPHLFLPDYDYYFWVDSTHDVVENPLNIIDTYLKENDLAVFKHTERDCVYKEADVIKRINYDHHHNVDRQINFYKSELYPENNGLWELPAFVRKNTDNIKRMNLKWWEQICMYSSRDQLSLPYCLYKLGISFSIMDGFANGINPTTRRIGNNKLIPQVRNHV